MLNVGLSTPNGTTFIVIGILFMTFLPVVATLILHLPEIQKKLYGPLLKEAFEEKKKRMCVECGREIPWDANLCPYCGHKY